MAMPWTDRDSLVALYRATGGESWKRNDNWDTDADLAEWFGVEVNHDGRVVKVELPRNNLQGPIPPEVGNLDALRHLDLSGSAPLLPITSPAIPPNMLRGTVPPELGNIGSLQHLDLSSNQLSGPIPPELGHLGSLQHLDLSRNQMGGTIPEDLGKLTALQVLDLRWNELTGSVPPKLGNLGSMRHLKLSRNQLSGTIPEDLGNLTALQRLDLGFNELTGAVPPELGNLGSMQDLNLSQNKLSGTIPKDLRNLTALERLDFGSNELTGTVPPELGNLGSLQYLDLLNNELSGTIPEDLGKLTALQRLDLGFNELTGMSTGDHAKNMIPVLLKRSSLFVLDLSNNPWELPPAAVVAAGHKSIRGYYNELQQSAKDPEEIQSLKVVFAGHSGAGKTSLIKTILAGSGKLAQGSELETVGVEVSDYNMAGKSTKFYDLAGQVDYYGLHQLFMTERAVYVMTWDASKYLRRREELVEELMGWISALHMRAPHCTVILAGTHSDKIAGGWWTKLCRRLGVAPSLSSAMTDVEKTLKAKHEAWKVRRGMSTDEGLKVQEGIVLVSSSPGPFNSGVSALLKRFKSLEGTTSFIPPSWSLALLVLDALKYGYKPLFALTCWEKNRPLPSSATKQTWIQKKAIAEAWQEVQNGLPPDRKAGDASFAMESALKLREFGGSLLQHEEIVFLDVEDLALRLAPVLNHKTCEHDKDDGCFMFGGKRLEQQWQQEASLHLIGTGTLYRCFACFLWETPAQPFPEATFDVLVKLGILLPLGSKYSWWVTGTQRTGDHLCGRTDSPRVNTACGGGFLVLMRLPNEPSPVVTQRLKTFEGLRKQWGLVSKWEFHKGAAPHGLVERIIASCHVVGDLVGGTCWRKGACFVGNDAGKRAGGGSYALMVDFCEETGLENIPTAGTLTIRAFGARDGRAVWGAMRFAISTVWRLFDEFPGIGWQAWLECPADEGVVSHTLPGPHDRRSTGDPIVSSFSRVGCPCSVAAGVGDSLGAVLPAFPSMDKVFQAPAGNDGGTGTIAEGASEFTEALDGVLRTVALDDGVEHDVQPTRQSAGDWVDVAIGGPLGVLALIGLWEPIVETADRWAEGGSLSSTLPLTLFIAALVLAVVIPLAAMLCRLLRRRIRLRWSSRTKQV